MTTYPFTPSTLSNFQFGPTLDGSQYNAVVVWNVFGQRYYLNVYSLEGALVCSLPMVGSPEAIPLASLDWANGIVVAQTSAPHGFTVGSKVTVTIAGCAPTTYNGLIEALVLNTTLFQYDVASNPGSVATLGTVAYQINLVGAFFDSSILIYNPQANQIEVNP